MHKSTSIFPTPTPLPSPSDASRDDGGHSAPCRNCDTPLSGAYCVACGQRAGNRVVPLWQVTNEFLEDLVDLDLRILHTLPTFFFRPGRLTAEYVRGRRRRYIRPLRLYLFSSFLLFTVLALANVGAMSFTFGFGADEAQVELEEARAEIEALRADLLAAGSAADTAGAEAPGIDAIEQGIARIDAGLAATPQMPSPSPDETTQRVRPNVLVTAVEKGAETQNAPVRAKLLRAVHSPKAFLRDMLDRAPYVMFLMVPTFALLLKGLYLRRQRLYLEHLIFALHIHAFAFIALSAGVGLEVLGMGDTLPRWAAAVPVVYLLVALRHVYGQSWGVSAAKTLVLLFAYGLLLTAAVVALVILSVALL